MKTKSYPPPPPPPPASSVKNSGIAERWGAGVIRAQSVALSGYCNHKHCPHHLRRVRLKDPETEKTLVFLTKLLGSPFMTFHALCAARR